MFSLQAYWGVVQQQAWYIGRTWIGWTSKANVAKGSAEANGASAGGGGGVAGAAISARVILTKWKSNFAKDSFKQDSIH